MSTPEQYIERMNLNERLQHGVMFVTFTLLAITGFLVFVPERYVLFMGGSAERFFQWRGNIHRISGVLMVLVSIYHFYYSLFTARGRWLFREMFPRKQDLADLRQMIRHYLNPAEPVPQFGWYSYVEKAEYWALVWGTVVMTITGFLLWFESLSPKLLLDIATIIHRYEAILAVLAIIVWHFYHVHWRPEVFPMNPVWLTGRISIEDLRRHHPLAYQSMMEEWLKESNEL